METLKTLADRIARLVPNDGVHATAVPRLTLVRMSSPTEPSHHLMQPAVCIIVRGRKQTIVGDRVLTYGAGQHLVVAVDVPIIGQIIEATSDEPYICIRLDIDVSVVSGLLLEMGLNRPENRSEPDCAYCVAETPTPLLDAAARLVALLEQPHDIAMLAPMIEREILYRLLTGKQSARLIEIATGESRLIQVNRAIGWIKKNYTEAFSIDELAVEARMSTSALHLHFKEVTGLSPLQYQKQLRLQEARRLILSQSIDAATASFRVGYGSPSQFSREYNRMFGAPPLKDVQRLRAAPQRYAEA
jgi:AraC-like DNA-binding protein